jgi:hypothetical protein
MERGGNAKVVAAANPAAIRILLETSPQKNLAGFRGKPARSESGVRRLQAGEQSRQCYFVNISGLTSERWNATGI